MESPFLVRLAGLPTSALAAQRNDALLASIRELVSIEDRVLTEGRALADELYKVIGTLEEPGLKPALVGLRRALFQGRRGPQVALPAALQTRLQDWLKLLDTRDALLGELPATWKSASEETQKALLSVAADPLFRHGIAFSSEALAGRLDKPSRQTLIRLAQYVSRAAAKTSPFSTFTTIGLGTFDKATMPGELLSILELQSSLANELAELAPPSKLLTRVNPSLTEVDGRYLALAEPSIVEIAKLPEVEECLSFLGDEWHPLDALREHLGPRSQAFVDRLMELGVLEARLPIDDQCPDPFAALGFPQPSRLDAVAKVRAEAGLPSGVDTLHEHVLHTQPIPVDAEWLEALDDLEKVRLSLKTPRPAIAEYCEHAFGPGYAVPLMVFYRQLLREPPDLSLVEHSPPPESVTWFVQPYGNRLVLNAAMSGHGRGRARWLHLLALAGVTATPTAVVGNVAESPGRFGHTLNLRLPMAPYQLDYPRTMSIGDKRPRIPLRDLVVAQDAATGLPTLRSASRDIAITPIHGGMMAEFLLPMGLQTLIRHFGTAPTLFRPERGSTPRIEAGLVILQRATWTFPADQVPQRARGETDTTYLLRLHRWLAAQDIPDRGFVQATAPSATVFTKTRKPLYIDFSSPWLLAVFERMISPPADRVMFQEALPPPHETGRVMELVIETSP